jgi:uncharacterized protein (DUF1501 family)
MKEHIVRHKLSRRDVFRACATSIVSASVFGGRGERHALAGNPYVSGYKALVCVQLVGGNNGFNTLVPMSPAAYATYHASRTNLAIDSTTLLPLNGMAADGNSYGLHPSCPELQTLFNAGHLAVVGNVGTLVQPTTVAQAQAGSVPLPPQLFSHIDQINQWMTSIPQSQQLVGWAGRLADVLAANGVPASLAFNINVTQGATYWQTGQTTRQYVLGVGAAPTLGVLADNYDNNTRSQAVQALLAQASADPNLFVGQYESIIASANSKASVINNALTTAGDLTTRFTSVGGDGGQTGDQGFASQLHEVARVVKASSILGDARQIFFVSLNGFDTHNGELSTQQRLLQYLSRDLNSFWSALGELNMQNNVTAFTMTEFGRTLGSNGDGSDHAWGNHQLVLGGAVQGGFYGTMPSLQVGGPDDFGSGRLVPTTSTDQVAATLARWFGLADSDITAMFPNLASFSTRNVGFMG